MKKIIVFLMCLCMVVTSVHADFDADECEAAGGTVITRNVNGATNAPSKCDADKCPTGVKKFCKSGQGMNWWSAFNWCKSINGTLARFTEMCPHTPMAVNNVDDACPALKGLGSEWVWSNLGCDSSRSFFVNLYSGAVSRISRHYGFYDDYRAMCE